MHSTGDKAELLQNAEDLLVAYTIFPRTFTGPGMFQHLENLRVVLPLPRYMIPTTIFPLDEFPMNVRGKPDRRGIGARNLGSSGLSSESGNQELSSLETYLCNLGKDLLPGVLLNAIIIDFHVDFFQLDGNSLLLVALRNRIQPSFDITFPLKELMEPTTLKCMAVLVQNSSRHKSFDWAAQTALPKNIERKLSRWSSTDEKMILLTGSTGYIGPQMIKQLVTDPTVRRIHAVTVRTFVTAQSSKIIQHSGDLSKPYLGLDKKFFTNSLTKSTSSCIAMRGSLSGKTPSSCVKLMLSLLNSSSEWPLFIDFAHGIHRIHRTSDDQTARH
nr:pks-nrps hybrid synthetase psoa [Quercus suber]